MLTLLTPGFFALVKPRGGALCAPPPLLRFLYKCAIDMKFGTVVLQPILNENMKKNVNFILMTSLTSCLKIIYKMAYRRRLKKGHHEILFFLIFFFYNSIYYYKKNLHTKFHAIWSICHVFIETYIFGISAELSQSGRCDRWGGNIFFSFYFPDRYRILGKVMKFHSKIPSG